MPQRNRLLSALIIALTLFPFPKTAHADAPRSEASSDYQRFATPRHFQDVEGRDHNVTQLATNKATVFVFASTECPISNLYMPRLSEIAHRYKSRGVELFLVDSNREDSETVLRRYAHERQLPFAVVKDKGTVLADWLSAASTPEGILLDSQGEVRYRGRIDDNQDRTKVIHSDLREALDALLDGKPVARPRTVAFGCAIFRDAAPSAVIASRGAKVTYAHDVAPILARNCVSCHRAGESAPFALETYPQAQTWATAIRDYTSRRLMPPWKAIPGHGDFYDARTLTDTEVATLAKWANTGAAQGKVAEIPSAPHFPDPKAWTLGKPDMVLQPVRAYHLVAEGADVYRNFVLPADFSADRYISAMEFKPGNRAVVHHIVLYIDPKGQSVAMEGKEAEPGYTVPGTSPGFDDAQWGEVWAPGRRPRFFPEGVAIRIPKGAKLVMQVHYHKNGAPQTDTSQVALFNARGHLDQIVNSFPMVNAEFALTPSNPAQTVMMHLTAPTDVHLRTIFPHMHLLGREMRATATLPDGSKRDLVYVKDWDFNWQETYVYKEPVALPKGTRIDITTIFDNSTTNPRQPNHPAKEVRWGEQTTDEMCLCVMGLTIDKQKLGLPLENGEVVRRTESR